MRCRACDSNLSDYESTRKYTGTQTYVDLCGRCSKGLDFSMEDRPEFADNIVEEEESSDVY